MSLKTYEVIDPAKLDVVGSAPDLDAAHLDFVMRKARAALPSWSADITDRRTALRNCVTALDEQGSELARLLTLEQGKVLSLATTEITMSQALFRYYADFEYQDEDLGTRNGRHVSVEYRPLGVVAAIVPWNYPLTLLNVKLAPALLAGNVVVIKPASTTPLATLRMVEHFNRFLPDGVVQVVTGQEAGRALAGHPGIDKIAFTGSTGVGQHLMRSAAATMKRTTLELGGNDPAVILEDSDVDFTVRGITASAFRNAGQTCMSIKRVYVPSSQYRQYIEAFSAAADALVTGHGLDPETTMGPLHTEQQLRNVQDLVRDAVNRGGTVTTRQASDYDLPGYFHDPTIVANAPGDAPLVLEEQFGSALPVVAYHDIDRLVHELNSQEFGLGASIWSANVDMAAATARRMDVGLAWVNQHNILELDAPFGGRKLSGIGRERGRWGLESFLEPTTVSVTAQI